MKTMERLGRRIASRPWLCIMVVLMITVVAFGAISTNGISFDLDEDDMAPQTDAYDADKLLRDVFRFEMQSFSLVRSDNALSKETFIAAVEYEKALFNDPVINTYLLNPNVSSVSFVNPYTALMTVIANSTDYDAQLTTLESMSVSELKDNVSFYLSLPQFSSLKGLFTTDLDVNETTAKGAMIVTVLNRNNILNNDSLDMLVYEENAVAIAANITSEFMTGSNKIQAFDEYTIITSMADVADSDLGTLFPLALLLMVALLLLMYRDFVDMIVAILCLIFAIIWTFGAAVIFDIGVSTISIAVPILVLGLGIDYALHLVFRYRDERGDGVDNEEACSNAVGSVGEALLLATITTMIAFLSNLSSSMSMIADFGLLSAIGILCSFIIMILVIPSAQSIRDRRALNKGIPKARIKRYSKRSVVSNDSIGRIAMIGGRLAITKPLVVLIAGALTLGGFGYAAANVSYQFDVFDFLPEESDAYDMLTFLFDEFAETGQFTAEVLVYGNATDPDVIRGIEGSVDNMKDARHVTLNNGDVNAMHIGSVLFSIYSESDNATYNDTYALFFDTEDGSILNGTTQGNVTELVGILMMMDDDVISLKLANVIGVAPNGDPITRIQIPIQDGLSDPQALALRDDLNTALIPLKDAGFEAVPTGNVIANAVIMDEMQRDQMTSLLITLAFTLVILTVAMFHLTRSLVLGTLATLPTMLSVVMVWGSMYLMDISLNVMTLTIAALTVGIGVTYGIHIVHRFASEMARGFSAEDAVMITTGATGRGVLGAALTTAVGFGVLMFSSMVPMAQFGMITAMAIAYAYIGATVALPTLLVIWGRHVRRTA